MPFDMYTTVTCTFLTIHSFKCMTRVEWANTLCMLIKGCQLDNTEDSGPHYFRKRPQFCQFDKPKLAEISNMGLLVFITHLAL